MTTPATTARDLDRMRRHIAQINADILTGVAQDAFASIVVGSALTGAPGQPVDTGYLRASWALFTDTPSFPTAGDGTDNPGTSDRPTPAPEADPAALIALAMGRAARVTIGTNTAYAEHQEYHHRTKAASVRLTVAGLPAIGAKAFRDATGGRTR